MQIRRLILTVAFVTAGLTISAHAAESLTQESCIAFLTEDLGGPMLDPNNLRIRSTVALEGKSYTIYEGRLLKDICEEAVPRSEERAENERRLARLQDELQQAKAQGAENADFRRDVENDLLRNYAHEITWILGLIIGALVFVRIIARIIKWLLKKSASPEKGLDRFSKDYGKSSRLDFQP